MVITTFQAMRRSAGSPWTSNRIPYLLAFPLLRFQNLSPKDKIACTAIQNPDFVHSFLAALPQHSPTKLFNLTQAKSINCSDPAPDVSYFTELLSHLRVGCL